MRDCVLWKFAAIGKYICQVHQKADMLWITWVHNVYIKDANWWTYEPPKDVGWVWKMIYKTKNRFKPTYYSKNKWLA